MSTTADILRLRLRRQLVDRPEPADPADVVQRLCAVQAQDYAGALWSVALRCGAGATRDDVERALADGRIVRTWPMRGTLHFVAARDVRWMLTLLTPKVMASATKRHADLDLSEATFERAKALFTEALAGGGRLTRPEAMALLEGDGIDTGGQRGYHILWQLSQQGLLCLGPMRDKLQTFVLLDDWVASDTAAEPSRDGALARLAIRYLAAHGPAMVADLAWWAGITKIEARAAIEAVADSLDTLEVDGEEYWMPAGAGDDAHASATSLHLLPGFDEYMLGYTDRSGQLGEYREVYGSTISANGMFAPTVVIGGRIAGMWKRTVKRDHVSVSVRPFRALSAGEDKRIARAARRYGAFLGLPAVIE